jgi:hypothetical protein
MDFNLLSAGKPDRRAAADKLLHARRACVCAIFAECDSAIIDDLLEPSADNGSLDADPQRPLAKRAQHTKWIKRTKLTKRKTGAPPEQDARLHFLVPFAPVFRYRQ